MQFGNLEKVEISVDELRLKIMGIKATVKNCLPCPKQLLASWTASGILKFLQKLQGDSQFSKNVLNHMQSNILI